MGFRNVKFSKYLSKKNNNVIIILEDKKRKENADMDELRYMKSITNSLDGVKSKYLKGIIKSYEDIVENFEELIIKPGIVGDGTRKIEDRFANRQYDACVDNSLGSNNRWGIISRKNFFGLRAVLYPKQIYGKRQNAMPEQDEELYLEACAGRFQDSKFRNTIFTNVINISDILDREPEEQFKELEQFYDMTNRELFEKFGVWAEVGNETNLLANCVVLDSLLQGRHSEMENVYCASTYGYDINIKLADGTKILAYSDSPNYAPEIKKGITIQKDGKEARVDFDTISMGERSTQITDINQLGVENVVYTGDSELIAQLQQAMQKQFKAQQRDEIQSDELGKVAQEPVATESKQPLEQIGAQKIIEYVKNNNWGNEALKSALRIALEREKMNSETNLHEGENSDYKKGVLEAYKYIIDNYNAIIHDDESEFFNRMYLGGAFLRVLSDFGLSLNSSFLGHKNLFGLEAVPFPQEVYHREEPNDNSKALYLRATSGRINGLARRIAFHPNLINISDILEKKKEEGDISEFETFYNMNNRQVLERFGVDEAVGENTNLIAGYIVLDSLLQGNHSEIEKVDSSIIEKLVFINLTDGTEIIVNPRELKGLKKGISIKKDGKEARVDFDTISIGERSTQITDIDDLEVENVVYFGETELIAQLQKAMQEQFKSQQRDEDKDQSDVLNKLLEKPIELNARKIIDFMNEQEPKLGINHLSLAVTMVSAKTTDRTKAEQHIISSIAKVRGNGENNITEHQV